MNTILNTTWRPNPGPQTKVLTLTNDTFEILYGGARGGGKTDAGLVWIGEHQANPRYRALVIRRNADDLSDWTDRARQMYPHANFAYKPSVISFPSGAIIRTGHLKDEGAYTKYQGHEYQRVLIEELTQIPTEKRYMQLISSCRSTVPDIQAQVFATTNPGGSGHLWVKERFIDSAPPYMRHADLTSGRLRVFVPAKVDDNPVLTTADPMYLRMLDSLKDTDEDLWKAWRLGDWNVFAGQVFNEWRPPIHVIDKMPPDLLQDATVYIGFDWGYNDPASAHWIAVMPENEFGVKHCYVYREMYANEKTAEWWAEEIAGIIADEPIEYLVLPHDAFSRLGGSATIASRFDERGIPIANADAKSHSAKLNRQSLMHDVLSMSPDGTPYIQVASTCRNFIRTLPSLSYSDNKPEEIEDKSEDHAYDSVTYGLYYITQGESWWVSPHSPRDPRKLTPYSGNPDGSVNVEPIDIGAAVQNNVNGRDWRSM